MCDYTQVEYACGHLRYVVRAWCTKYQETQKRCPANVVALDYKFDENCGQSAFKIAHKASNWPHATLGDCKQTASSRSASKKPSKENEKDDRSASSASSSSKSSSNA